MEAAQMFVQLPGGQRHAVQCPFEATAGAFAEALQFERGATVQDAFHLPASIRLRCEMHTLLEHELMYSELRGASSHVTVLLGLCGGKGGYGSQLRAMGRKTVAGGDVSQCRDLSGRRLRDVEAAEKLAEWQAGQRERDDAKAAEKQQRADAKAEARELEAQAIQDEAVAATRTRVGVVAKSVTAGILEAAKLDEDRKRKQADGAEAAKKRAKVFMLCVDDGSDEDSSSEDDSPPSAAAVPGKNL